MIADAPAPHDVYNRLVSHWRNPTELVHGSVEPLTLHTDAARWPQVPGIVEHMSAVDAVTYLPDDILCKVDRATMSVSLEGRMPLLARNVVEFAATLPQDIKVRSGVSKWLRRTARCMATGTAQRLGGRSPLWRHLLPVLA